MDQMNVPQVREEIRARNQTVMLILYTGVRVITEAMTKILGTPADPTLKLKIIHLLVQEKAVQNVTSLILHNYGESVYVGAAEIEVDENLCAGEIAPLSRRLIRKARDNGVILTTIGVSSTSQPDPELDRIRDEVLRMAISCPTVYRIHSFTLDPEAKTLSFSVVQALDWRSCEEDRRTLLAAVQARFPDLQVEIHTTLKA